MAINVKQRGSGYVVLSSIAANDGILLNTVGVQEGANSSGETVASMSIAHIMFTGHWHILRGSNTVFDTGSVNSVGDFSFQSNQIQLENSDAQLTSNCTIVFQGGGDGFIAVKLHKRSNEQF